MSEKKKNPLVVLWNVFSGISGVLGFSSLVDTWFDDFLAWRPFALSVIATYRSIVDPVFNFLFAWVPFDVPRWIGDYLVLAFIGGIAFRQAQDSVDPDKRLPNADVSWKLGWHVGSWAVSGIGMVFVLPIYLLGFPAVLLDVAQGRKLEKGGEILYEFAKWLGAIVLGFVVLLAIGARWNAVE